MLETLGSTEGGRIHVKQLPIAPIDGPDRKGHYTVCCKGPRSVVALDLDESDVATVRPFPRRPEGSGSETRLPVQDDL